MDHKITQFARKNINPNKNDSKTVSLSPFVAPKYDISRNKKTTPMIVFDMRIGNFFAFCSYPILDISILNFY